MPGWLFIASLGVVLCWFSLGHYEHNDHMYAVAPVLARHFRLYTDIAWVQTPLSALIYAGIDGIVGDERLWATLRVFSLLLELAIVGQGIAFCYRHARRPLFASVLFVSLFFSYRQADIIGAEIGNYTLALVLTVVALTVIDVYRGRSWAPLVVGLLAGLALSVKLSYIYNVAAFAVIYLVWERAPAGTIRRLAAYGLGVVVGVVPILYYLVANFDLFFFENVHFHYLSSIYRGNSPFPWLSSLAFLSISSAAVPLAILFASFAAAWFAAKAIAWLWPASRILAIPLTVTEKEILCVGLAALIGAITPGTIYQQYFAPPAFAFFLFGALYLDRLTDRDRFTARGLRLLGGVVLAIAMGASIVRAYAFTTETIVRWHDGVYALGAVDRLRSSMATVLKTIDREHPGCHGDLVTAFGVPAIGSGANFAPIDSTGPFAMRLDAIFAKKAPRYRWMTDPLTALNPRSLILVGFYVDPSFEPKSPFEATLDGYATSHHFQAVALGSFLYRPITLYVPPGCATRG